MKKLIATLLATAAGAAFAQAPTAALNHDPATYHNATKKAEADYKAATAKCASMSGNDKEVCIAQAKAARTRAQADAFASYTTSAKARERSRTRVADADYALAKAKCGAKSGAEKDECLSAAKSAHSAALAEAKAGHDSISTTGTSGTSGSSGSGTVAAAVNKCEDAGGNARTGCLIQEKSPAPVVAAGGASVEVAEHAENAADKTKAAASNAAEKTKELAKAAVEKTKQVASSVTHKTETALDRAGEKTREVASTAQHKTEHAMDNAGEKTRDTAATIADKTERATDRAGEETRLAASDAALTTKVKASLIKEPDLKSMEIHVKTENGVVMLSGFVDSKAEAQKAVKVAKGVEGVTRVRSAIAVK
jgi:osmotically-inducible protein OsmY